MTYARLWGSDLADISTLGERAGVALGKKDDLYGADVVGAGHVHGEYGVGPGRRLLSEPVRIPYSTA